MRIRKMMAPITVLQRLPVAFGLVALTTVTACYGVTLTVNAAIGPSADSMPAIRAGALSSAAVPAGPLRGAKYVVRIIKMSGFRAGVAMGAGGRRWVGVALRGNKHVYGHAVLGDAAGGVLDINPKGCRWSLAYGVCKHMVVGEGDVPWGRAGAFLWRGRAWIPVRLGPVGAWLSQANALAGGQEVGCVMFRKGDCDRAALWRGSPASFVDLNPKGYKCSVAVATDGRQVVGWGRLPHQRTHALLWLKSGSKIVDLNPAGFVRSEAHGVAEGVVVGYGETRLNVVHAICWHGRSLRPLDINPAGDAQSKCFAIRGSWLVGCVMPKKGGHWHAAVWAQGTAKAVDLQQFLPGRFSSSCAYAVTASGDVYGTAVVRKIHLNAAIEWQPMRGMRKSVIYR